MIMKDIRPQFTEEEYSQLLLEADRLEVSLKQLVRDRALGIVTEDTPLTAAKILSDEISKVRDVMNRIIRRETTAEIRLFEDDIIRLEMAMKELEGIVAAFISEMIKKVRNVGDT
jgi:hypothetical protein